MTLRPIFYDTETTGLDSNVDRIIEIAAFDSKNNKTFCKLVNPNMPIPKESIAISNITDEMVKDAPTFDQIISEFVQFCSNDSVLIAHNNDSFDIHFLKKEFERAKILMPNWIFFDTLKWARKYRPDLPRHSLQYLREIYNIPANQAHRALDDVIVLEKIFSKMVGDLNLETILKLSKNNPNPSRMPFGKHQGKLLSQVPRNYISWLMDSGALDKPENKELKEELLKLKIT